MYRRKGIDRLCSPAPEQKRSCLENPSRPRREKMGRRRGGFFFGPNGLVGYGLWVRMRYHALGMVLT